MKMEQRFCLTKDEIEHIRKVVKTNDEEALAEVFQSESLAVELVADHVYQTACVERNLGIIQHICKHHPSLFEHNHKIAQCLSLALASGDQQIVRYVLSLINFADKNRICLNNVCSKGDLVMFRFLVEDMKIPILTGKTIDNISSSPFVTAAGKSHFHICDYLLLNGVNINMYDSTNCTALYYFCCIYSYEDAALYLLDHGADTTLIATSKGNKRNILCGACERGMLTVVQRCIEMGMSLEVDPGLDHTLLTVTINGYYNSKQPRMTVIACLLDQDILLNGDVMHAAMTSGHHYGQALLATLLSYGADIHCQNYVFGIMHFNLSLLELSCLERSSVSKVRLLLERGLPADSPPTDIDKMRNRALTFACFKDQAGVVDLLHEFGARGDMLQVFTTLPLPFHVGNISCVQVMLKHGISINIKHPGTGQTLLHVLCEGQPRMKIESSSLSTATLTEEEMLTFVQFAVEHGADVNAIDHDGQTSMMIAERDGKHSVVQYLQGISATL